MGDSLFAIARSGLDVERQRMDVIAQNLANAGTTRTADGQPYHPLKLVSGPRLGGTFDDHLNRGSELSNLGMTGVQSYGIERVDTPPRMVYDPAHPHADAKGFVAYPGIDHAGEMTLMVQTLRSYEADTVIFNAARSMYMRALELGARS
ncbi:flagellar basal body rod protein FlgC [Paraburkholderia sp. Se-20369]|uniref:flagellar basal body rod protein FlgC n=1 Tax=Burkholderia stagnalis TaxID=1503054 RepID=UPI000F5D9256|nr:flagellar basal body rod protein FlgC [Burkholderia stagnalis]MBN3815122.1 flagellar basal body rod protein FlgC [Paraburkholderia sp. Se-20369]TCW78723.1 flagellar basal body rod protein FlgC [Burkholderia sp. SRS-46]RQX94965.1 flagellar basal body rod protein FlgC [Burkholderia stagnalis]RQY14936.1 flagellar basal body rod protein FlgC [Burkholderia stagnalis]RQY32517.1 flagellar basal body rod protein FlgC [Burkholderia stagnalis]